MPEDIDEQSIGKISLEQANDYLNQKKGASFKTAVATFLCITSVIPLFLLIAFSEMRTFPIVSSFAIEIIVFILFLAIAIAVYLFVWVRFENAP